MIDQRVFIAIAVLIALNVLMYGVWFITERKWKQQQKRGNNGKRTW
jgi:hypothetical protein